jgi:hypothetical protein
MKLVVQSGACSLSPHIVLHEKIDLKSHRTSSRAELVSVHGKDYVPVLVDSLDRVASRPKVRAAMQAEGLKVRAAA